MRKLKLESLQVESFETTTPMPGIRGTVQGHRPNTDGCVSVVQPGTQDFSVCIICEPPQTYDINACGDTRYMDCTFGCSARCSYGSGCPDICWIEIGQSDVCPVE